MKLWIGILALAACEKSSSPQTAGSPAAAARCQVQAIETESVDRWAECLHPAIRAEGKAELAKRVAKQPGYWDQAKERSAALVTATDASFTMKPLPADKTQLGDQSASVQLEVDSFEVVRKDGRWYIVDSGI